MFLSEECSTPDSVVGANILLDGQYNGDHQDAAPSKYNSDAMMAVHPDDQLVHLLARESCPQYQVSPDYLHSCILLSASSSSASASTSSSSPCSSSSSSSAPQDPGHDQGVSERCRRRTCEWMYDICDYFQLHRDVVAVALFYVDRYFTLTFGGVAVVVGGSTNDMDTTEDTTATANDKPVTRREFQLVALTSLYIAIKLHGESRHAHAHPTGTAHSQQHPQQHPQQQQHPQPWNKLKFNLAVCASISRHQFTPTTIEQCECQILSTLQWHVNPIVPSGILIDSLMNYLPSSLSSSSSSSSPSSPSSTVVDPSIVMYLYDCAKYMAELSVSVPALCLVYLPSVVSYASILYAMDTLLLLLEEEEERTSSSSSSTIHNTNITTTTTNNNNNKCSYFSSVKTMKQEYQRVMKLASRGHFQVHEEKVQSARRILEVICPNLKDLFPSPSSAVGGGGGGGAASSSSLSVGGNGGNDGGKDGDGVSSSCISGPGSPTSVTKL